MAVEKYHDFPLAPIDRSWSKSDAEERLRKWASSDESGDKDKVDFSKLKECYFWNEGGELTDFGQLKFPYCDIIDNKPHVVHNACQNALARLENSSVPDEEKPKLRGVMEKQINRFSTNNSYSDYNKFSNISDKPTPQQMDKINKFSLVPLTEDDVFIFNDLMIDDSLVGCYFIKLSDNLLNKFMQDATTGIALLTNHDSQQLPVGRSFDAVKKAELDDNGNIVNTLYGSFYIDLNRNTQSGMTTNDIVKGIKSGTIFDTSVGFKAYSYTCSICGNDIRNYGSCPHIPGESYDVKDANGVTQKQVCYAIVGDDGEGELLENSLVFAGACDRASIQKQFSQKNEINLNKSTKLKLVDNIKEVPLSSVIYTYLTKDGVIMYSEKNKGSEDNLDMKKIGDVLNKYGFNFTESKYDESIDTALSSLKLEVGEKDKTIESLKTEISEKDTLLSEKDELISNLEKEKNDLSEKAKLGDMYRDDLVSKTLEMGVRLQGNVFDVEMFKKFLETLSVEEIKNTYDKFTQGVNVKYPDGRVTHSELKDKSEGKLTKDSFETEDEFRAYVADEAKKYAVENNVSLGEATKIVYKELKGVK